jgi:hypothetical protein
MANAESKRQRQILQNASQPSHVINAFGDIALGSQHSRWTQEQEQKLAAFKKVKPIEKNRAAWCRNHHESAQKRLNVTRELQRRSYPKQMELDKTISVADVQISLIGDIVADEIMNKLTHLGFAKTQISTSLPNLMASTLDHKLYYCSDGAWSMVDVDASSWNIGDVWTTGLTMRALGGYAIDEEWLTASAAYSALLDWPGRVLEPLLFCNPARNTHCELVCLPSFMAMHQDEWSLINNLMEKTCTIRGSREEIRDSSSALVFSTEEKLGHHKRKKDRKQEDVKSLRKEMKSAAQAEKSNIAVKLKQAEKDLKAQHGMPVSFREFLRTFRNFE